MSKNVLILDDRQEQIDSVKMYTLIVTRDVNFFEARTKEEAIEQLSMNHIDLLVSDVRLDEADENNFEGLDVAEYALKKNITTIIASSFTHQEPMINAIKNLLKKYDNSYNVVAEDFKFTEKIKAHIKMGLNL